MRVLFLNLACALLLLSCDLKINIDLPPKVVATPHLGLNLTLPASTIRPVLSGITSNWSYIDSDSMTASADWVLQGGDPTRNNSNYHYVSTYGVLRTLTGNHNFSTKSRLMLIHQITTDSAALVVKSDTTTLGLIAAGASALGWSISDLGSVESGSHALSIETSDPFPKFAYVDTFISLPVIKKESTLNRTGWIEQDHPQIYSTYGWSTFARSTTFPTSVSSSTGTGLMSSNITGSSIYAFVEVDAPTTLRIWGEKNASSGQLGISIDNVDQVVFDQYSSTTDYRGFQDYSLTAGEHLIKLTVTGLKNVSSSGFNTNLDALELKSGTTSDDERAMAMIDSIVNNISALDGAPRIAHNSSLYNQDNDSGYSLMALGLAVAKWNIPEHAAAFKKGISWFADVIDSQGIWYWGYCKDGETDCPRSYIEVASQANCENNYCPSVNSYYSSLVPPITAIRSIDAPQSFPAVALAIYASLYPSDAAFINSVKPKILSGIDSLIANNYDQSNGLFYSSYQFKNGSWQLFEAQYSAGQCDVFMGLMSAYSLTGTAKYKTLADGIKNSFDSKFYDPSRQVYSVALFGPRGQAKTMDTTTYYGFAQGWCNWVFGKNQLAHGSTVLTTNSSWIQGNLNSILIPGESDVETSQSSWLLMGLNAQEQSPVIQGNLKNRLRNSQFQYHPDNMYGGGGLRFSDQYLYYYSSSAAWAFLGLSGAQSPSNWWK